jgi:hypothetical protein
LELRCHFVELVGKYFHLIAGFKIEAISEIAAADPFYTLAQDSHRTHNTAR